MCLIHVKCSTDVIHVLFNRIFRVKGQHLMLFRQNCRIFVLVLLRLYTGCMLNLSAVRKNYSHPLINVRFLG